MLAKRVSKRKPKEPGGDRIFVVDDEASMREVMSILLRKEGYIVETFEDPRDALEATGDSPPDLVIQDLNMPGMHGIELLEKLLQVRSDLPVIIITAFSSWETAVSAMRLGAYDYIRKPFDNESIRTIVRRAISQNKLSRDGRSGSRKIGVENIIGASQLSQDLLNLITRVAATDATVLVSGESGTGKELLSRAVHFHSLRSFGPFISVNCGAFTESLLESELFGHVKGAFTGAYADKLGLFEVADKGTFFLDEVGDLAPTTQVKLLRVLEERRFLPVGATTEKQVDVRFVAATNRNLPEEVAAGHFREDLFYRLNVIPIHVAPLRERKEDIPLLAGHFLARYSKAMHKPMDRFSEKAARQLAGYDWPGNIRELENTIQRAVAMATGSIIEHVEISCAPLHSAPATPLTLPPGGLNLENAVEEFERRFIEDALDRMDGNMTRAADLLGLTFRTLRYKAKKLGIKRPNVHGDND